MDNLSTSPDKSLSASTEAAKLAGLPTDWIEQVCQINWPPSDSNDVRAQQASLLIRAKDFLNTLTKPANGSTIAFTLLVTNEDNDGSVRSRRAGPGGQSAPTRRSMAEAAYPGLISKARHYRKWILGMSGFLLFFLACTCALSWYVAYGNAALSQLASAKADYLVAEKRVMDAESGTDDPKPAAGTAAPKTVTVLTTPARSSPTPIYRYCDRPKELAPVKIGDETIQQFHDTKEIEVCDPFNRSRKTIDRINRDIVWWMPYFKFVDFDKNLDGSENKNLDESAIASAINTILGGAVLPVFYGLLGAGAAVLRSLSFKMKTSQLAPRDLPLSFLQLALGAVIGACIGLFVNQPSAAAQTSPGLLGTVALSGSALSFIAGFGVEHVFVAIEALLSRVFLGSGEQNKT